MSRGLFQPNNKENKVFTYYTNASSATTFSPSFTRTITQKRLHIDYGDNSSYDTGLSFSKVYSDSGTLKKVKIIGDTFTDVDGITSNSDLIVGNVDLTPLNYLISLNFGINSIVFWHFVSNSCSRVSILIIIYNNLMKLSLNYFFQ